MNNKKVLFGLALPALLLAFALSTVTASPLPGQAGPYVDQLWYELIKSPDAQLTALLTHAVDEGGVPRPADLPMLTAPGAGGCPRGFTITHTSRIGYTMLFENNIVYPTCDVNMRRAINRLVDKAWIVSNIFAPLMGLVTDWLPPSSLGPTVPLPTFDPGASPTETSTGSAASYLNQGGYAMDPIATNPYYDSNCPWSAPRLRIDPLTGSVLAPIEYRTSSIMEAPLVYMMDVFIADTLRKAGLQINLMPTAKIQLVSILTNAVFTDYQLLSGVGVVWGTRYADILYDFLQSGQVPLWNFWNYASALMDFWAATMKGTLNTAMFTAAAAAMQAQASLDEPFLPMLYWNEYVASTGPYAAGTQPGVLAIVNHKRIGVTVADVGFAVLAHYKGMGTIDFWSSLFSRKEAPPGGWSQMQPLLKRIMSSEMTTLNPLMANTAQDWQILSPVIGSTIAFTPYDYQIPKPYWYMGHTAPPIQAWWVGPDNLPNTSDDGMQTVVQLRNDLKWDDGTPVTAYDYWFTMELLKHQNNDRYRSYWENYDHIQIINPFTFQEFVKAEQFIYRFESLDVGFLIPRHIWEPYIQPTYSYAPPPSGVMPTMIGSVNSHTTFTPWQQVYLPSLGGTKLLGKGPFYYPMGSWQPTTVHIGANRVWWGGKVCLGDVDLSGRTDLQDLFLVIDALGAYPGLPLWENPDINGVTDMLGPAADIAPPAQIVTIVAEIFRVGQHWGHQWGPGYPPE